MASVSEELRKRIYGSAAPTESQIQAVRQKAYTIAPASTATYKVESKTPENSSGGLVQMCIRDRSTAPRSGTKESPCMHN